MKTFRRIVILASCTGLVTLASAQMPDAVVVTDTAQLRRLAPTIELPGTVVSRNDARLASELEAKLEWIAEVGTEVKEGETVARLEKITFQLRQMEAESRVAREQARVTFLRSERSRLEKLSESNLSARSQLDQVISDLAVAESDEAMATAQLGLAQVQMYVTEIRAPFNGVVTERLRNMGERLNVADEVIRLVDPASLEIIARAPLSTVNFIEEDDVLEIHNDYRSAEAAVRTIVPFGNPQSHMFEVRLDADHEIWTVGENVRLSMPTAAEKEVLAVPRDALILRREGASVFKVLDDNTVEQVKVITGLGAGTHIEVIGKLVAGDVIVVRGAERLSDGASVSISNLATTGSGNALN